MSHLVNRFADPRPLAECDACGSTDYEDRRIRRPGTSSTTMRVCRRCERFMGFVVWHGLELATPPLEIRGKTRALGDAAKSESAQKKTLPPGSINDEALQVGLFEVDSTTR